MSDLNEIVSILDDLRAGVAVALHGINSAPLDVKELDVIAYSEVIDCLTLAKSTLDRLHRMAQMDADEANRREDTAMRREMEKECYNG